MTVCIAALADDGQSLVLTADRMVTWDIPTTYAFEQVEHNKIATLTDTSCMMGTGNSLHIDRIHKDSLASIQQQGCTSIDDIAILVADCYKGVRQDEIEARYLSPRGLTLDSFYSRHQQLTNKVVDEIDGRLEGYNLGSDILVAGQGLNGMRIFVVRHPGRLECYDTIGFLAVGSGYPFATSHLLSAGYSKSLPLDQAIEIVGKAKKMAEANPGVGSLTTTETMTFNKDAD